jgi:hypothetical protein
VITCNINDVPTLFIKGFKSIDVQTILQFVRRARGLSVSTSNIVLFIDTPVTLPTFEAVEKLVSEGFRVVFRDHHGIDGTPANDRERQVSSTISKLQRLLGDDCRITVRRLHPACSTLVEVGEFADAVAIIADPDADGLTAAMKACGVYYDGLDDDAAKLDGEPHLQVTGTPISQLLAKGVATLPSFDPQKPDVREIAQQQLFSDFVQAVAGNAKALAALEAGVAVYDVAVTVAHNLAHKAIECAPDVVLVDCVESDLYDVGTLTNLLEQRPNCKITVLRKELGPIAAIHGIQYSLSVAKAYQDTIDLKVLVPHDAKSGPQYGIITNVSFVLHVSESAWKDLILPQLQKPCF